MSASEKFTKHINLVEDEEMRPIFTDGQTFYDDFCLIIYLIPGPHTFVYIRHNNIYIVGVTKRNANCMIVVSFLYRLVEVFTEYFNELEVANL